MRARLLLAVGLIVAAATQSFAPAAASSWYQRPVRGPILRRFERPPTPFAAGHRGIDMGIPIGTAVGAANDGIVAFAGRVGFELFVSIDHADGIRTTYSFLSAVSVKRGEVVTRGQPVAASGPGHAGSTTAHLHFGARIGEEYIDPEPLLLEGLRRDVSQAIRLVPAEPYGEPAAQGGSIAALPGLLGAGVPRRTVRRRRARNPKRHDQKAEREADRPRRGRRRDPGG